MSEERVSKKYVCERCNYSSDRAFLDCPNCKPKDNMRDAWFGEKKKERSLLGY